MWRQTHSLQLVSFISWAGPHQFFLTQGFTHRFKYNILALEVHAQKMVHSTLYDFLFLWPKFPFKPKKKNLKKPLTSFYHCAVTSGSQLQMKKTVQPTQVLFFLGIEFDTVEMII